MKYKLKRDLPFAKAGDNVEVNPGGCIPFANYSSGTFSTSEEYIDKLIKEGWIEEVKPREWELWLDKDGCVTATSKECCIPIHVGNICKEIIKVREVL